MTRWILVAMVVLAAVTAGAWQDTVNEEENSMSSLRWRLLYESKNEKAQRLVPFFIMTAFALIAIAIVLENPVNRY